MWQASPYCARKTRFVDDCNQAFTVPRIDNTGKRRPAMNDTIVEKCTRVHTQVDSGFVVF